MTTDLTADDDSVQVVVFYQYTEAATEATHNIGWKVDYGDASVEGETTLEISGDNYAEVFYATVTL